MENIRVPQATLIQTTAARRNSPRTLADLICSLLDRHQNLVASALLVGFFILALLKSRHKTVWFDEVFTAIVAMQPDWQHFVGAMPAEGNPPLNTLLTSFFIHIFGVGAFGLRLTPMLGFTGALAGVYIFIRRECGGLYGLLAILIVLSQPAWRYAFEARPYGLLLLFLMVALTGWQSAVRDTPATGHSSRLWSLTTMALGIAGCILSHNMGVLTVSVPLLAGEMMRVLQRKRLDWPVLAAGLVGLSAMSITIPMIIRTHRAILVHVDNISFPITPIKLLEYAKLLRATTNQILEVRFLCALVISVVMCWRFRAHVPVHYRKMARSLRDRRLHTLAASVGALVLVPITWLAMIPSGGWYFSRYGIGTILGISLVSCLLLSSNRASNTTLMILLALAGSRFVEGYVKYVPDVPLERQTLQLLEGNTTLPVVVSNAFSYPALWWYASQGLRHQLYSLTDTNVIDVVGSAVKAERPFWNAHIEDFDSFLQVNDHFYLLCPPGMEGKFRAHGFSLTPLNQVAGYYEVRRTSR